MLRILVVALLLFAAGCATTAEQPKSDLQSQLDLFEYYCRKAMDAGHDAGLDDRVEGREYNNYRHLIEWSREADLDNSPLTEHTKGSVVECNKSGYDIGFHGK